MIEIQVNIDPLPHDLAWVAEGLRNSLTASSDNDTAVLGTSVEYAAIHHFGGRTPPHIIRPKRAKALAFNGRVVKNELIYEKDFLK